MQHSARVSYTVTYNYTNCAVVLHNYNYTHIHFHISRGVCTLRVQHSTASRARIRPISAQLDDATLGQMADSLELEVQPEKSIGTGNWEFSLGEPRLLRSNVEFLTQRITPWPVVQVFMECPCLFCDAGMPLVHVIQVLKTQLHVLRHADVIFSQNAPLEADLQVDLREGGILLKFDPRSQRLKVRGMLDQATDLLAPIRCALHCSSVDRCVRCFHGDTQVLQQCVQSL